MRKQITICITMLFVAIGAIAQQNGKVEQDSTTAKKILTFDDAVRLVLQKNVLLNTQRNNLDRAQMQKLSAFASSLPNLMANGQAARTSGNSFNSQTGTVVNGVRDNVYGQLSSSINIFTGFAQTNFVRQTMAALEAQSYFVKRTAQDAINTVATQYLRVMLDKQLVLIGKENWDAQNKQLQQVQAQVDLGSKAPVDGFNQGALAKTAELLYVQAEIALNNDKAILAQTLLMDAFEEFDTERPNWDVNAISSERLNIQEMADRAKENRGDFLQAVQNERAQKFSAYSLKGQMGPSFGGGVSIGSNYNYQHGINRVVDSVYFPQIINDPTQASGYSLVTGSAYQPHTNPDVPQSFSQQFRKNNLSKQIYFSLSIPLFNGFKNRYTYVAQKVIYENAVLTRENIELQIKNDVVKAARNYDGAKKAFQVTAEKLSYAEKAMEYSTESFNLGATSFVDFSNASKVLIQAQTDKAQAEYTLIFQKIMLAYSDGTLKPEDVSDTGTK